MPSTLRQIFELFDARERWLLGGVFLSVLLTGFLEVAGVASIMPFMALVADPDAAMSYPWMRSFYDFAGFTSVRAFLVFAGVLVFVLMILTNAFTAFSTWLILRFSWRKHHRLSEQLLQKYLHQPYSYFLGHNTSNLSKNILTEAQTVVEMAVVPAMTLVSRAIVAAFVIALLFFVDPGLAVTIGVVLGGAYALIYLIYRRTTGQIGAERLASNEARFKAASEALGGIKDVKVLSREPEFMARFSAPSKRFSENMATAFTIAQLPRYALDTLAFGGLLLMVLYFLLVRGEVGQVIPIVSLYAVAGYRLLPTLQQVFHSAARLRFGAPALKALHADLTHVGEGEAPPPAPESGAPEVPFSSALEVRELGFRYPNTESWALHGVSVLVPHNQTVALVGQTGSGKTTLVDVVLGLLSPQEGEILVDGNLITAENLRAWKRRVGYVPQQIFLSDDTIARNIAFGLPENEVERGAVERAARIANLHDFITTLPQGYETVVGERGVRLSGGQRQRIGIARALYADPDVLIMDEATSALDGITEDTVMQAIRELNRRKTIILIAHRLRTVRHCDLIYLLEDGRVVAKGTYDSLLRENPQFKSMATAGAARPNPAVQAS